MSGTEKKPHGAGRSSIEFIDFPRLLRALPFTATTVFVDLGCGRGNYSIAVAEAISPKGRVYGIDAWQEGLEELEEQAASKGLNNIVTIRADLNRHIPLEAAFADICFMATVLHDLLRESSAEVVMREIVRVLKPSGRLAIIEFKKVDGPGPPLSIRLSPEETEEIVRPFGFVSDPIIDLGPYHYLFTASRAEGAANVPSPTLP
jgi:ubiquinone/menaquinone biosynthesis C-methylase UbiE